MEGIIMSILKKILSATLAVSMCGGVYADNGLHATAASSYIVGDVDDNGVVNIIDLAYIQQFLNGSVSANTRTAQRLDVNYDYIIDVNDKNMISDLLLNGGSSTTRTYPSSMGGVPDQIAGGVSYCVYDVNENEFVEEDEYTLSPLSDISTASVDSMQTRGIIGSDDRVVENGLMGVLNIQDAYNNNVGTAFVVDSHTILTVAHALYSKNNGVCFVPTGLQFKVFSDYNTPSDEYSITPVSYHIPKYFMENAYRGMNNSSAINSDACKYDYAIVTVREDLSDLINFNLGIARTGIPYGTSIYVTGFGGNCANINPELADVKSTGYGNLISSGTDVHSPYRLRYQTDAVPGNSGSPAYVRGGNNYTIKTVVGINHVESYDNTYNGCVKVTTDVLHFIFNNNNL